MVRFCQLGMDQLVSFILFIPIDRLPVVCTTFPSLQMQQRTMNDNRLLGSTHIAVLAQTFYYYLITNFGNFSNLAKMSW